MDAQDWAERLLAARANGLPALAADEGLDLATAYEAQALYVAGLGDQVAGFKAGATNKPAQQGFGLEASVAGVLIGGAATTPVAAADFRSLVIETEIGYRVGRAITNRPASRAELLDAIDAVAPAVELPDFLFANPGGIHGHDLVAANVAARTYLLGDPVDPDWDGNAPFDPDAEYVRLEADGELAHEGHGRDVDTGQLSLLEWLVGASLGNGHALAPGHWLITGAIGGMRPGRPGRYTATWSTLGSIEFDIV